MKLIIAGGRDFADEDLMRNSLQDLVNKGIIDSSVELVCGMAAGADRLGKRLFDQQGLPVHKFPADWEGQGRRAGFVRNAEMGRFADLALIFWDGKSRGTNHMINYMKSLGKPTYVVMYNQG